MDHLRSWFATHEAPGWYRASGDSIVGRAMRMLHNTPAHPWTVAAFQQAFGMSPQEHRVGAAT